MTRDDLMNASTALAQPIRLTRRGLMLGAASAGALAASARLGRAAVKIEITEGNVAPLPIAIPDFVGGTAADGEIARGISQIIAADLRRSSLFAPIDPAAYIEKLANFDAAPSFADWRVINAQALVTGRLTRQGDGRLKAEFRLWDVFAGQQLIGQQYFSTTDTSRRIAHLVEARVRSPVARVTDTAPIDSGPGSSPDGSRICFESERGGRQQIYLMEAGGGAAQRVSFGDGSYSTPVWSPRGDAIAFTKQAQ